MEAQMERAEVVAALAATWATMRQEQERLEVLLEADATLDRYNQAVLVAKADLRAAQGALADAQKNHPTAARLTEVASAVTAGEESIMTAWQQGDAKTFDTAAGRVQVKVTPRVQVLDATQFAKELLDRQIFAAAVKGLDVDAKFLLPLIQAGLFQGAKAIESKTIAWTRPKVSVNP